MTAAKDFDGSLKQAVEIADAFLADTEARSPRLLRAAYSRGRTVGEGQGYQFIEDDNTRKVDLLRESRRIALLVGNTKLAQEITDVIGG